MKLKWKVLSSFLFLSILTLSFQNCGSSFDGLATEAPPSSAPDDALGTGPAPDGVLGTSPAPVEVPTCSAVGAALYADFTKGTTVFPPATINYYVLEESQGANFIDFQLSHNNINLQGQSIAFNGSAAVDAVFARPGVPLDFTASGAGQDKLYLSGKHDDYNYTIFDSVIILSRCTGDFLEVVRFSKDISLESSDLIVFADGTLNSFDIYAFLNGDKPLPFPSGENSKNPLAPAALGSELNANIKAIALNAYGVSFATTRPGIQLTLVGGAGVDTAYVEDGANLDATRLGLNSDLIYLRGNWADYTKVLSGSVITFTRTIDGKNERVVVAKFASINDKLIFADGSVFADKAFEALTINSNAAITEVVNYDNSMVTPL